jgi:twitching motility protein PilT
MSQQELLGTVLDGVGKEIFPEHLATNYLRGDKVSFLYQYSQEQFQILLCRTTLGTRIVVGRTVTAPANASEATAHAASSGLVRNSKLQPYISKLLSQGGSDLYLNTDEQPIIRLDGNLEVLEDTGFLTAKELEELVKPIVPVKNWEAFQTGMDTEFSLSDASFLCRMRVSLYHDAAGPSVAIRVIPQEVPDPEMLGLAEPVRRLAHLNKGLVLLTGPMGSGKSTTMASLLDIANRTRKDYIVTIQDSIEFEFPKGSCLLRQREVGWDVQRQKAGHPRRPAPGPDILAIGEIREPETIELALQAAHTGRVVMATLQTTSLMDTFYYLVDAFPHDCQPRIRARIADCLKAVVGHTLLRKAGGGRVACIETLFNNPTISELIREDKIDQIPGAMKSGRYGQLSHNEALTQLILSRKAEPMEAYLKCQGQGE